MMKPKIITMSDEPEQETDPLYCPYCMELIEPDEYGVYAHYNVYHPKNFNPLDYKVMH